MKYKWLQNNNQNKLIIFFNGWGMDENAVNHLDKEDYDILMFYDYNSLETNFDFSLIYEYKEKHIVAWSMGVMLATLFNFKVNSATAINGTLRPIDNNFGIPVRIYDLTIRGFSEQGAKKFIQNMFENSEQQISCNRDFENQKSELSAIKNYSANEKFKYNKIFISKSDKIIPTKNQVNYWNIEPNLEGGHYPFFNFNSWSEIL